MPTALPRAVQGRPGSAPPRAHPPVPTSPRTLRPRPARSTAALASPGVLPMLTLGSRATGPEPFHRMRGGFGRSGAARAKLRRRRASFAPGRIRVASRKATPYGR